MADKAARKTPVRTAPARKDFNSELEWLQAKIEHVQAQETKTASEKVTRINKRIASVQAQRATLDVKLRDLTAKRDAITGTMPQTEEPPA